ncbi:hypothetical protein V1264_016145 [Littorina saxatilis]
MIELHEPDVIAITEVKPKRSRYDVQECEIAVEGFELFHNMEKEGRGIALYVKTSMKPALCEHLNSDFQEAIFVECQPESGDVLRIGLVYRSPNSSLDNATKLNELLMKAVEDKPEHLLILGDFNYPQIDWNQEISTVGQNHPASQFLRTYKDAFLTQHQRGCTRFREGQEPSLVDLVLSNREDIVQEVSTLAGLGKSDHVTLNVKLAWFRKDSEGTKRPNYSKADFAAINEYLKKVNWENEFSNLSVDDTWKKLRERIQTAVERHVPVTRFSGRSTKKWMDKGTLRTVRKKHKLFRKWLESRDGKVYQEYCKVRNQARRACRKAQRLLEQTVAKQAKRNPKAFWSYVKNKTKTKTGIADLKKEDGTKTTSDQEKAEVLNAFFKSVFTAEADGDLPDPPEYNFTSELRDFEVTSEKVKKLLEGLQAGKAPGPDGLSPLLLSKAADALAEPVAMLFRKSLDEGRIPEEWRHARVTPIFKKGSKLSANNYRPVSLTCILCKVMETLVREQLIKHLQENDLITDKQHGFVQGRSCVTQLLDVLDTWTQILDEGGTVDAVYMDFKKAFDSVPHRRLVLKTEAHGIGGRILAWIADFLSERRQCVVVNGVQSSEAEVTSGIPQGSVLGPMLFVLYINDLPNVVANYVRIFADDTKVYTRSDVEGAPQTLQKDLDSLQDWSQQWLMNFHPEKCHVLKLGNKRSEAIYYMTGTDASGEARSIALEESDFEKDLGVYVDNNLSFNKHVALSAAKANRVMGVIRRSFDYLTVEVFLQLYKSLVRPILEYGHAVWQPQHKTLCQEVERVQRRATKLISSLKDKPYSERLATLKLPCLEHRRKRGDMIEVYKYLHGFYKTERPQFSFFAGRDTRGSTLKLSKPRYRLNVRGNFFSERVVNTWNSLPDQVVTAPSVNAFKARLDAHWKDLPSVFDPECY